MNKHGTRDARKRSLPSTRSLWTATLALIVVVLVIARLNDSFEAPSLSRLAIGAAVLLLVARQIIRRRSRGPGHRASEPDPKSRLDLS